MLPPSLVLLCLLAAPPTPDPLAARLRSLDGTVLPEDATRPTLLARDVRARLREAGERESKAWRALKTKADWEKYRDARLTALRASLGTFPVPPKDLQVKVTGTLKGDGYTVEKLVFESRPGLLVTANLYLPARAPKGAPGILLCHSHHAPKTQAELQDMGVTWARAGCLVLVMDQLGHGERRQHPFRTEADYARPFRVGRQDYYFRYNVGLQLHLAGDSLMGWMAWDLMRGVDLLLGRPGVDKDKILLLGAVAGGGDPAAVAAALDGRIAAVVPFNFGGPQPETTYPLPADAEKTFLYTGGGSWEPTRNLYRSARDGFLPWVIVGATAPRRLVYAHEFAWDRPRDPVWPRLQKVYAWHDKADRLAFTHGKGRLSGKAPEASHCTNIGTLHREAVHAAFEKWFGLKAKEARDRRPAADLLCLTKEMKPRPVYELAGALADERADLARRRLARLTPEARRRALREEWGRLLGVSEARAGAKVTAYGKARVADVTVERFALEVEPGVPVPVVLLLPPHKAGARLPVVVAFAQEGKQAFLQNRAGALAALLRGGAAVALPDLRGTGETKPGSARGRASASTAVASSELMLGRTLLGARLRDLRTLLAHLAGRADLDPDRVALWGDGFAPANAPGLDVSVPLDADPFPRQSEPLGGLLALLGGLFEDRVAAVYASGGLSAYRDLLKSPFVYAPYDVVVPGALTGGDLADVAAAVAPAALRLEALVDGLNRRVSARDLARTYRPVREAYEAAGVPRRLRLEGESPRDAAAGWVLAALKEVEPVRVVIKTTLGDIEIELDARRAPVTVANFLRYVDGKRYDGGRFHRTVRADNQPKDKVRIAVVQAGVPPGLEKKDFPPIKLERTNKTGLKHKDGTISMARDGPDTATSDFFVCVGDQPGLDFGGKRNPDGQGFAAFGRVVKGMEVIKKVHAAKADGQTLKPSIKIVIIRRKP